MSHGKTMHHISTVIPKVVEGLTAERRARARPPTFVASPRGQKGGVANWLSVQTQQLAIKLAEENGWEVQAVFAMAIRLLAGAVKKGKS